MSTTSALLLFDDERKAQLDILNQIDESAAVEICNVTLEFLSSGFNAKVANKTAKNLQLDADQIRTTIDTLLWLHTECAKTKISVEALEESLKLLGYSQTIRQAFINGYQTKATELQKTLSNELTIDLHRYKNISWRFDVQVATRHYRSRKQIDPFFILKLVLVDGCTGKEQTHVLQVDPLTMVHLVEELEAALNDLRNNHARKIMNTFR